MQTIPSVTKKLFTSANGVNMKRAITTLLLILPLIISAHEIEQFPYRTPEKNQERITKKLEDLYDAFWLYRQFSNLVPAYSKRQQADNMLKITVKTTHADQNQIGCLLLSLQQSARLVFMSYRSLQQDIDMILSQEKVCPIEFLARYPEDVQNQIPILNNVMQIMSEYDPQKKNGLEIISSLSTLYCNRVVPTLKYETPHDNLCL